MTGIRHGCYKKHQSSARTFTYILQRQVRLYIWCQIQIKKTLVNPIPPCWRRRHYKQRGIGRHRAGGGRCMARDRRGERGKRIRSLFLFLPLLACVRRRQHSLVKVKRRNWQSREVLPPPPPPPLSRPPHPPPPPLMRPRQKEEEKEKAVSIGSLPPPSPRPIGFPLPLKSRGAAGSLFLSNLFRSFSFLSVRRSLHPSPRSIRRPSPLPPLVALADPTKSVHPCMLDALVRLPTNTSDSPLFKKTPTNRRGKPPRP